MRDPTFGQKMSERMWKCEGLFAEAKQNHGLSRARYRGRSKVQIQAYLIAIVLLALSVGLLVQGIRGYRRVPLDLNLPRRAPAIAALLLFTVYLAALPRLGFLIASIPFAGGMLWLYGGRNKLFLAAAAVGLPLLLSLLFREVLRIPLPHGSWSVLGG